MKLPLILIRVDKLAQVIWSKDLLRALFRYGALKGIYNMSYDGKGRAVQGAEGMAYKAWITAWALALIWGMACPAIASGPELREIRFEKGKDGEERVLFVLNGDHPPKSFAIEGKKPRLICDFFGVRLNKKVKRLIKVHDGSIKAIRVGIHLSPTPKIRVVLDLRPDQDYEILQAFFVDRNIYAVVLRVKSEV